MTQVTFKPNEVIIGIDTHKDTHVAVALNTLGVRLGDCLVPATLAGYEHLLTWARALGQIVTIGVEGTGSYGRGLTRFLQRQGLPVIEVSRPCHRDARRLQGKNDVLDAERAARQVLDGQATAIAKTTEGTVEMMRLIKVARDTAVKARTQVLVSLKAILVTADEDLRALLEALPTTQLVVVCAQLEVGKLDTPAAAMRQALSAMAKRWLQLHQEIETHNQSLSTLTRETAPNLVQAYGIGPDTAAEMLITFGDNHNRVRCEAAFAKLCGVCPLPASSGRTQRHRLNRGGNRRANAALFRVVIVRMRWHEPTKAYVARRAAEGLSKREIIRCLKRYLAREVYRIINQSQVIAESI